MQADVGGVRFGARLRELRQLGFAISEERLPLPTRGSRYTLVSEPEFGGPAGQSQRAAAGDGPEQERSKPGTSPRPVSTTPAALFDTTALQQSASYRDADLAA